MAAARHEPDLVAALERLPLRRGTDLTKTANIPLALAKGINVALAPDWSIGGSQNLLDELRFADQRRQRASGATCSRRTTLVQMVTTNAAQALGLGGVLGSLAPGKKADLMVIGGDRRAPVRRAAGGDARATCGW